jgi:iron complex transport system permease protein
MWAVGLTICRLYVLYCFQSFCRRYRISIGDVFGTLFGPPRLQRQLQRRLAAPAAENARRGLRRRVAGREWRIVSGRVSKPARQLGILGVSNGAGFGAALSIVLFGVGLYTYVFSFAFAIIAVLLSYLSGRIYGSTPNIMLILGGVVVSSFFGALTSIMKFVADTYSQLPAITFWLMGSFANVSYTHFVALIPMTVGSRLFSFCAGKSTCCQWETKRRRHWAPT